MKKRRTKNLRVYEETHKIIKKFADKNMLPMQTLLHRMALKLEFENKDLSVIEY